MASRMEHMYSFDGGAGDVFAGGVGGQSPEDTGGVGAVGGAFAVEVGQEADAVGAWFAF